mmetsp:Transcript_14653/g.14100  ORF Transcript_14653/g.14100 Transcript_14653/m.14100 type:complete len:102 (+) Transcript_14653:71-376(+)|eukprot:CAMPEP_0119033232 /NCGR_PEP_ID=MMETSP1177-20130426/255_1 /TAXON_ID=2985 /ORGANISM="Ochromonas sp, Strain CCMP1899" /LENGTH=101 /DNA_ID=CAMNT_0006989801 /DNA_START=51 /DNA_END=356 /DNA_ORIENTATION=+
MFASRFARAAVRVPIAARPMGVRPMSGHGGAKPDGVFKERTLFQAWCMDSGAYPVMSVIVFAVMFSFGSGLYIMSTHPDARWSKDSRTKLFRGELKYEYEK